MAQIRDSQLLQNIAVVLKELRDEKELTQDDVFDATSIHIGRIETARANVTVSTISRLCQYFEISLSEFFTKVEKLNSKKK